ncbi:hypothetical protein AVEN_12472-1 [Araneus ventricosus]|uniref:Uncharacterized protein n=1 Tax=Araneus ventricosus TaxID=182803 RepID=A0A4Y2IUE9_ARAVE|nr:hypothetical protein AVEN_12472-1 [Araneus ventricosus]
MLFHYDHSSAHTTAIVSAKLHDQSYQFQPHSCCPDLSLSVYYPFQNMKTWLAEMNFSSNGMLIAETAACFEGLEKFYYMCKKTPLKHRRTKCINVKEGQIQATRKSKHYCLANIISQRPFIFSPSIFKNTPNPLDEWANMG